jgi:hypothetical protein
MATEPPHLTSTLDDLVDGEKMIVSAHSGGVLTPDAFTNKRQHVQALREDYTQLAGYHTWNFTRTGEGLYAIQNVTTGRHLEPLRKSEDLAVYENVRFQGPILLETGVLSGARNAWEIRRRGDHHQIALKDSRYVIGLMHPDHKDSWLTLLDAWWSVDRLWLIQDVPA